MFNNKSNKFRGKGFTLVELLVVISIIALLLSILMPSLGKAREIAKLTVCSSNMHQLGIAVCVYDAEWNGWLLPATSQADEVQNEDSGIAINWGVLYELDYCGFNMWYCPADRNYKHSGMVGRKANKDNWGVVDIESLHTSYLYLKRFDLQYEIQVSRPELDSASTRYYKSANLKAKRYQKDDTTYARGPIVNRAPSTTGLGCDSYWVIDRGNGDESYTDGVHKNKYNIVFADGHTGRYNDRDGDIKGYGASSQYQWHDAIWNLFEKNAN